MNIGNAFPSKYLKAANLDRPVRVKIDRVEMEDVSGKKEMKPVLYFIGKEKGMVLNKTNSRVIEDTYGKETDDWRGAVVEIFPSEVSYAGDMVPCLRLRIPKGTATGGGSNGGQGAPVTMAGRREQIRNQPAPENPVSEEAEFQEDEIPF